MSLGAYFPKNLGGAGPLVAALNQAVNYAQGVKGKLVVSAAGNNGSDLDHDVNFVSVPAESGSGISAWAGAVDGSLASYSNHGVSGTWVGAGGGDFTPGAPALPGCALPATAFDGITSVCSPDSIFFGCGAGSVLFNGSGTSFSAPMVSGVAALAKGRYPNLTGNQLKTHLQSTADDVGPIGVDNLFSHGRVNAKNAVQ
jgi:subtilisin family serine protease